MFVVALIKGSQYKVTQGEKIKVAKLENKEGDKITISDILLVSNGDNVKVGAPHVEGAAVEAKVVSHGRGEKIRVIKYKRRKRYLKTQGHRQDYTEIEIVKIVESGAKKAAAKTTAKAADEKKAPAKKAAPKATAEKAKKAPAKKVEKKEDTAK